MLRIVSTEPRFPRGDVALTFSDAIDQHLRQPALTIVQSLPKLIDPIEWTAERLVTLDQAQPLSGIQHGRAKPATKSQRRGVQFIADRAPVRGGDLRGFGWRV